MAGEIATAMPLTLVVEARSLDLPQVQDHPNRHPFSGILTKVGVASDTAPNGSGGKRVLLTRECVEGALDSLLGMGIDLAHDLKGHAAQSKIGVITGATIDGEDLLITGFLYAADFPAETLKIVLQQAQLGFSFEARNLAVESVSTDPLIVKSCFFTGAAVLMKDSAAYRTTAIAAAAAKENEMEEIQDAIDKALPDALAKAMEPFAKSLADLAAGMAVQGASIEAIMQTPALKQIEANAAMVARVEPHCAACEAAADSMEQAGVGVAPVSGHTHHLRRMASAMRQDAAGGKLPSSYRDSGAYYAAADPTRQPPPEHEEDEDVKVQDAPEFKALQASSDKTAGDLAEALKALKTQQENMASMTTIMTDMKAQMDKLRPAPERKTIDPGIANLLARTGIAAPEDGTTIPIGKIDAAFDTAGMDTATRMRVKTALSKAGIIGFNGQ